MAEAKKFTLHVIESQIIKMTVVEDVELEQKDAKAAIAEAVSLGAGKRYCILFDANVSGEMSHEARDEFAQSPKRIAVAIVTDNLATKIVSNFFIKFHKPLSASRIFSEEQPAIEWLREKIAEYADKISSQDLKPSAL